VGLSDLHREHLKSVVQGHAEPLELHLDGARLSFAA
jgi:hypothetical protein